MALGLCDYARLSIPSSASSTRPKRSETASSSEHALGYVDLRLGGPKRSETAVSSEYALAYVTLRLGYVGASFC